MSKRLFHLVAFLAAAVTIGALAFALMTYVATRPTSGWDGRILDDPDLLRLLLWIGGIGGVICASIVATRTAWAMYCWG